MALPIAAWVLCGAIKFGVNAARHGYAAIQRLGHGGFPSNHTAIVSSVMWAFMLAREWQMAGLALAVLMISIFDATALRRQMGFQAAAINRLAGLRLREIIGHTLWDVAGGLGVGLVVAFVFSFIQPMP